MPWKETCAMLERRCFVEECMRRTEAFSQICRRYAVSRKTGYKWLARHRLDPEAGLRDGRGERKFGPQFGSEIVAAVSALREAHKTWGPEKLVARLRQDDPERRWPSASTVKTWLRQQGVSRARRRTRACPVEKRCVALRPMTRPNAVWCIDFKGWFYTADRRVCEPLTLTDGYSRYLLTCEIVANRRTESVQAILERVFAQYGRPEAIRSDNGAPFGSGGLASLTPLSIWLIGQGVYPEKIRPGHPEENSRHERFHRTLKAETARPPAENHTRQQERFDAFRRVYNHERPHGALGQTVPADHYQRGAAAPHGSYVYPASARVHDVDSKGYLRFSAGRIYLTESLACKQVRLTQQDEGRWDLDFLGYPLGEINEKNLSQ